MSVNNECPSVVIDIWEEIDSNDVDTSSIINQSSSIIKTRAMFKFGVLLLTFIGAAFCTHDYLLNSYSVQQNDRKLQMTMSINGEYPELFDVIEAISQVFQHDDNVQSSITRLIENLRELNISQNDECCSAIERATLTSAFQVIIDAMDQNRADAGFISRKIDAIVKELKHAAQAFVEKALSDFEALKTENEDKDEKFRQLGAKFSHPFKQLYDAVKIYVHNGSSPFDPIRVRKFYSSLSNDETQREMMELYQQNFELDQCMSDGSVPTKEEITKHDGECERLAQKIIHRIESIPDSFVICTGRKRIFAKGS